MKKTIAVLLSCILSFNLSFPFYVNAEEGDEPSGIPAEKITEERVSEEDAVSEQEIIEVIPVAAEEIPAEISETKSSEPESVPETESEAAAEETPEEEPVVSEEPAETESFEEVQEETDTVEIVTDNADGTLLPFLTANVLFETARADGGICIPSKALRFAPDGRPDGKTVFVLDANGQPRPVKVEVLLDNGLDASVKGEGLSIGAHVVTGVTRRSTTAKSAKDASGNSDGASPFMPKMPRPPKRSAGGPPH